MIGLQGVNNHNWAAYVIVFSFLVFMVLIILLHCHLKKQHAKWLEGTERFNIYRFEWDPEPDKDGNDY